MTPILYTCISTFILNIPFGFFRDKMKKLSFWWFFMIHIPVPFVVGIRKFNHIELSWTLAPFLFGSYFLGQWIGKKINQHQKKEEF